MRISVALLLAPAAAALAFAAAATAGAERADRASATIATVSSSDFRAELVARRTSGGSAPTATAVLTAYRRGGARWQRIVSARITGIFFWKTLAGPRAICRFELATALRPHVTVQLLQTPALGCGHSRTISLVR